MSQSVAIVPTTTVIKPKDQIAILLNKLNITALTVMDLGRFIQWWLNGEQASI